MFGCSAISSGPARFHASVKVKPLEVHASVKVKSVKVQASVNVIIGNNIGNHNVVNIGYFTTNKKQKEEQNRNDKKGLTRAMTRFRLCWLRRSKKNSKRHLKSNKRPRLR